MNRYTIPIGDWSDDGHGKCKEYDFLTNYSVEVIQQGYRDSCKLVGVQFHSGEDMTGLRTERSWNNSREICADYEESTISGDALDSLEEHGLTDEYILEYSSFDGTQHFAETILWFISLSMPKDFVYEIAKESNKVYLNGYWGNLNEQFGYGLFY